MRQVLGTYSAPSQHWVGDGFPVRSMLSHNSQGTHISPFILLDYAGPTKFAPTTERRGVGQHPHKGFETVTVVYEGEVIEDLQAFNADTAAELKALDEPVLAA